MNEFWTIFREALPEIIGGLIVAAILAIIGIALTESGLVAAIFVGVGVALILALFLWLYVKTRKRAAHAISRNQRTLSSTSPSHRKVSPMSTNTTVSQSEKEKAELLDLKRRRLHELQKKEALMGINTPPEVLIEIEEVKEEMRKLGGYATMVTGDMGSEARELQELIGVYRRRLHKLRVHVVLEGRAARPADLIEIEDIEKKLAELAEQLSRLMAIPAAEPADLIEIEDIEKKLAELAEQLSRLMAVPAAEREAPTRELEASLRHKLDRRIGVLEASLQYLSVSLRFSPRGGDEYEVLLQSEVGDVAGEFVLPFTAQEVLRFKFEVERAILARGSGFRGRPPSAMERLKEFGLRLYKGLPEAVLERYQAVRDRAATEEYTGVRLRLNFTDSRLTTIPWEFLYDLKRGEFLGLSGQTLLVRYTELPYPPTVSFRPPLKILVVAPSPRDLSPLDAEQEHRRIEGALKELGEAGLIAVHWLDFAESKRPVSLEALHDALFAFRPHVLHFIGHGTFDEQRDEGTLFFEDKETWRKDPVSSWRLAQLATSSDSLRLVFLNACKGAETSEVEKLSSVAAVLVQKGIPAVIGMQFDITDEAAIEFSGKFYQRLAEGAPVDTAVQEGRIHLGVVKDNPVEWATPVLYLLPRDGRIFKLEEKASAAEREEG